MGHYLGKSFTIITTSYEKFIQTLHKKVVNPNFAFSVIFIRLENIFLEKTSFDVGKYFRVFEERVYCSACLSDF